MASYKVEICGVNTATLPILKESEKDVTVLMSCSSMPVQDFIPACELLKSVVLD